MSFLNIQNTVCSLNKLSFYFNLNFFLIPYSFQNIYNSYLDFFLDISFIYAAVIIPVGRAITATPTRADIIVMN